MARQTERSTRLKTDVIFLFLLRVYSGDWLSSFQWPVGYGFVAVTVGSEILIWGGTQYDGSYQLLPLDVIYYYDPNANTWNKILATGQHSLA